VNIPSCSGPRPAPHCLIKRGGPQYQNLEFTTQVVLTSLVMVLVGAALIRAGALLYRKMMRILLRYPRGWTSAQCRLMDRFRLGVGVTLTAFWAAHFLAVPLMPTNWPFGLFEMLSITVLLLLTNAWIMLLLPRDWGALGVLTARFAVTITVLGLWWGLMFGGTAWMLATATTKPPRPLLGSPVVAFVQFGSGVPGDLSASDGRTPAHCDPCNTNARRLTESDKI
jgi:hypothetical protein